MIGRLSLVGIAFLACAATAALAQLSPSAQAAVDAYRSAITSAESGTSPRGIEAAFSAVGPLRDALIGAGVRAGQPTVLESLADDAFTRLQRELRGAVINREEVVLVEPEIGFFQALAAARGDATDRAFFAALHATYPESVWPVYVEQQTDPAGCTRFGSMTLVDTYRRWTDFQRLHPSRYAAAARKETDAVLEHLTESTCTCGSMATVEQELQQFLRRVPTSTARATVTERLQAVRSGRSRIRPGCVAG